VPLAAGLTDMLFALMKKELLALSRDLHGMAALFLMPVLFIVIMSLALKDVYSPPVETIAYLVDDRDGSELARTLLKEWEARHGKPQPRGDSWRDEVMRGSVGYALVIEKDFAAAMLAPDLREQGVRLRLLTDPGMEGGSFAANQAELLMLTTALRGQALLALGRAPQPPAGEFAL
jgi:ABC-2 type transport system permease protein